MKLSYLTLIFTVFSKASFALPAVGDSATYLSGSGSSATEVRSEIIAIDGLGGYTKRDTATIGTESVVVVNTILPTDAQITLKMVQSAASELNCQSMISGSENGVTATLETRLISSNFIQVCHIHYPAVTQGDGSTVTSDMWFGDVPFGLVEGRTDYSTGASFSSLLVSFNKN